MLNEYEFVVDDRILSRL